MNRHRLILTWTLFVGACLGAWALFLYTLVVAR